jgi:predicted nucleotidyltransferase
VSLLARVSGALQAAGIPYALIGASALTIHGVNRSTIDVDLFVLDPACLDRHLWD